MGTTIELPCGFEYSNGRVERSVTLSKIKGKVQRVKICTRCLRTLSKPPRARKAHAVTA